MFSVSIAKTVKLFNPRSVVYFTRTREEIFGPLEELAPSGSEKRAALVKAAV